MSIEAIESADSRNGTNPNGFGIACTVTWTELYDAMTSDGMSPPNKCGPATRKWIEQVVRDYLTSQHPSTLDGLSKIVREAAEVLQMVADSGVPLPPNWRWPLADELSGFAYLLGDASTAREATP